MSSAVSVLPPEPPVLPPLTSMEGPPRKKWTRAECEALEAAGILDPQQCERLELIEGELIEKMSKKRPHSNALSELRVWLGSIFGERFVQQEVSIDVAPGDNPINEPEPDLIVLARPFEAFRDANPQPEDLRLVVEIASTSLRFDCSVKAALYARAGIVEYWVFDVNGRRLLVHRDLRQGVYASVVVYGEGDSVAPLAAPDSALRLADILPPAAPAARVIELQRGTMPAWQ